MNGMSETNKVVLAAILGIIIGFGFGRFSANSVALEGGASRTSTSSVETGATSTVPAAAQSAATSPLTTESQDAAEDSTVATGEQTSKTSAVSAVDQAAGRTVTALATLDRQGWVVVHEQTAGVPGRVLGAKPFGPATASVVVSLLRGTVAGATYYVMLHSDDGDINDFNLAKDVPLLGANGLPIMMVFRAQ
ncbi:MAG: hypothetical protein A2542_00030 [Parcubacteria group bacterium RIFOXYD2_FULL_52_8]|nr:MAG: hypothetical protein A2542_00030 [Parcubacteria group bacterium RIFOXYD2_FULL_52_8]